MSARPYKVYDTVTKEERIIIATNQPHAIRYASLTRLECSAASAMEVIDAQKRGIVIEDATAKGEGEAE